MGHVRRIIFALFAFAGLISPSWADSDVSADSPQPSATVPDLAKPSPTTAPFPRQGTDLETQVREQQEYIQWMHENTANQDVVLLKLVPEVEGTPRALISRSKAKEIGAVARIKLVPERLTFPAGWQVFRLPEKMTEKALAEICLEIKTHPYVVECTPGGAVFPWLFVVLIRWRSGVEKRAL